MWVPVCRVGARESGFMGFTAVDGHLLRDPVAARLLQAAQRGLFLPVLREQQVHRLTLLIHGTRERPGTPIITACRRLESLFPHPHPLCATLCGVTTEKN
jgi:hypothetical protein